jgi:hypothetical protein
MFADLKNQFENTWKQYENLNTENTDCHSIISNKLNEIQIKSNQINESNLSSFDKNVKQEMLIEKNIENCVEVISKEISSTLEQVNQF